MQELAEMEVVAGAVQVVPERGDVLLGTPLRDLLRRRESFLRDVHHGSVRLDQFVETSGGPGVDFFGDREASAARFGETDQFLEPRRACGFYVKPGVMLFDEPVDAGIDRKLIATGMNA